MWSSISLNGDYLGIVCKEHCETQDDVWQVVDEYYE
jgi:hypothetical protein